MRQKVNSFIAVLLITIVGAFATMLIVNTANKTNFYYFNTNEDFYEHIDDLK